MEKNGREELARAGADSVFAYVERTAEPVEDGVRWETLSYQNEPQYDPTIFNGVAGIGLFLADYHRLTGHPGARQLAVGAARWSGLPEHGGYTRGLYIGQTGVGMVWLHLSDALEDPELLAACQPRAEAIADHHPGPVTDILGGAAGNGVYLLRLWKATGEERWLETASRNGVWLREQACCPADRSSSWHRACHHWRGPPGFP